MKGQEGKILRVNLTKKKVTTIETKRYEEWIGGHGIAAAVFWNLVKDKVISAFDPKNTLVMMSSLFAGTLIPGSSRMEIVGIAPQPYPTEWFTRSNAGGRFPAMLKYAGYYGIVLEGAADKPTWINIVEGDVELRSASGLWGLDTYETQRVIFKEVNGGRGFGRWETKDERTTIELPAVFAIGPAGEKMSRLGVIIHDGGCAFGQGGFGGVWGAKNLKAISVIGTRGVEVADPNAVIEARLWAARNYAPDFDSPKINPWQYFTTSHFGGYPNPLWATFETQRRPYGCYSCCINCRSRTASGLSNQAMCTEALFYQSYDKARHGRVTEISGKATDLLQKLGINSFELYVNLAYLKALYDKGILGPCKEIETDLPFDKIGEAEFVECLLYEIAYRKGIGDDLAEGFPRAAERWGRLKEDLRTGILRTTCWGYPLHYDPRCEAYWGYASLMTDRDINCHDFNVPAFWMPTLDIQMDRTPIVSAEEVASIIAEKCAPYNDSRMIDFGIDNLYSDHMAKTTAWLLHYALFWKQSCGLCDNAFADFINPHGPNNRGLTPEGEVKFFKAVTGIDLSFVESMEIGRKMLNLDRAIWVLQGRHRNLEKFPEFIYSVNAKGKSFYGMPPAYYSPVYDEETGKWHYKNVVSRHLDRNKVEEWKTRYYDLEGWDPRTGWPTRPTLEELGLKHVAGELEAAGKLPNSRFIT